MVGGRRTAAVAGLDGTHEGFGYYIPGSLVSVRSLAELVVVVEGA